MEHKPQRPSERHERRGSTRELSSMKSHVAFFLMTAAQKLGEMVYANMQAEQAAASGPSAEQTAQDKPQDDNVVDAEVKEVKKP